jgi:hypothetical protein
MEAHSQFFASRKAANEEADAAGGQGPGPAGTF